MNQSASPTLMNGIIYAAVIALMIYRISRPQRISVARMFIFPGILMALTAGVIYTGITMFDTPFWSILVAILAGAAAGVPLGILRGHHTDVCATERHGVMQLGASWQTAFIYVGAFALRFAIRAFLPMTSAAGAAVGDGLLVFVIAMIGTTYFVVYQKYEALDRATAR